MVEATLSLKQIVLAVRTIGGKTEIDGKAEKIGRTGRRGTSHEEDDLRVL